MAPGGISNSPGSPVRGSTRLTSLWSPSQVPCQSSPSTQVTLVANRLDVIVAKNRAGLGIDSTNFPVPVLPDPQRSFRPREARVTAAAGRRDRGEDTTALRIDLLDAILGDVLVTRQRSGE